MKSNREFFRSHLVQSKLESQIGDPKPSISGLSHTRRFAVQFLALFMATTAVAQDHGVNAGQHFDAYTHPTHDYISGITLHNRQHATELAAKFIAAMPNDPFEAMKYLVDKINAGEEKTAQNRTVRIDLKVARRIPGGELYSINPVFSANGNLTIEISLDRALAKNPALVLETLAALDGIVQKESFKMMLKGQGPTYASLQGIDLATLPKDHVDYKWLSSTVDYAHPVIRGLGVRSVPRLNGTRPLEWAELKMNVEGGSRLAAREMAEIELMNAKSARDSFSSFELFKRANSPDSLKQAVLQLAAARGISVDASRSVEMIWADYTQARVEKLQAELDRKTLEAKQELREKKAKEQSESRRKSMADAESFEKKLNDYVQANDRENTARLLETYIPLETLEPVEREVWKEYIEAIRNPRTDKASTVVLFRGTEKTNDGFRVHTDKQGRRIPSAIFSTMLAKNQGNYTRRLRSFSTMRSRFAVAQTVTGFNSNDAKPEVSPLISTPKVSNVLLRHASAAVGSPYISFSKSPIVALGWAESYLAAVRIDRRRVTGNVMSGFNSEVEMLVPLLVFPEEVIYEKERVKGAFVPHNIETAEIAAEWEKKFGEKIDLDPNGKPLSTYAADFAETYQDFGLVHSQIRRKGMCGNVFQGTK